MDWYSAAGRRAFFALPPESAHRLAGALLRLPLPWARIGGAAQNERLQTTLAGIPLRNPIGLAAGFDKTGKLVGALGELGFGYVVAGTFTRRPRAGNPAPRIARFPRQRSMVNSMGLPNPGAAMAAVTLERSDGPAPVVVSIADEEIDDALVTLEMLAPRADAIELNASCPNVSWGRDRGDEEHLQALVTAFVARTDRPVFVKLPPFTTDASAEGVLALAGIAQEAGARGLTCSNTRPVATGRLAAGRGGLSGRALWPGTPKIVAGVRGATGGELAVNASGGVFTAEDVRECLDAGATTVQIYTSFIYRGPAVMGDLTRGLLRG